MAKAQAPTTGNPRLDARIAAAVWACAIDRKLRPREAEAIRAAAKELHTERAKRAAKANRPSVTTKGKPFTPSPENLELLKVDSAAVGELYDLARRHLENIEMGDREPGVGEYLGHEVHMTAPTAAGEARRLRAKHPGPVPATRGPHAAKWNRQLAAMDRTLRELEKVAEAVKKRGAE